MEAGSHEYPLAVWYPGSYSEGYSVRSLYLMPSISYSRAIDKFSFFTGFDLTMDLGAPDPGPGVAAWNSKTADRKDWYTVHLEQRFDYVILDASAGARFPGTIAAFLKNENYIYAYPEFPEVPGKRPVAGKVADGTLEAGLLSYKLDFDKGSLKSELSLPLYYLYRYSDDIGFGMNFSIAYTAPFKLGLEIISRTLFIPSVEQAETEFVVSYDWLNFTAKIDITAAGDFTTAGINPELQYHLNSFTFTLGFEVSDLVNYPAFSPYMGLNWKY